MAALYIKCDVCGATFDGAEYDTKGNWHARGYSWGSRGYFSAEARARGWTGKSIGAGTDIDRCADCSSQNSPSGQTRPSSD